MRKSQSSLVTNNTRSVIAPTLKFQLSTSATQTSPSKYKTDFIQTSPIKRNNQLTQTYNPTAKPSEHQRNMNDICIPRKFYSDTEIISALRFRTICRHAGYEFIRDNFPTLQLPASDTINKRIRSFKAHNEIQSEMLNWLKIWLNKQEDRYKDCILVWDEMGVQSGLEYSRHTESITGVYVFIV